MTAEILSDLSRATDDNSETLSGAKWYFYVTETTTPQDVYTTADLDVAHPHPVVADAGGQFDAIYFDATVKYRGVLKTAGGVTVKDIDPINAAAFAGLAQAGPGQGAELVGIKKADSGAVTRTVKDFLREGYWSAADFSGGAPSSGSPAGTDPNNWFKLYVAPDLGTTGREYYRQYIPNTVNMQGGGAVEGAALVFEGETTAQTPSNSSISESNVMRFYYHVKSGAGKHLWPYLMNGLLISEHNVYDGTASGDFVKNTEGTCFLFTHRSIGPAAGAGMHASGVWAADLHVEKSAGTAVGKMIGAEIGVHTAVTGNYASNEERQNGLEVWSGNRVGSVVSSGAVAAHDAIRIYGDAGWTKMFRAIHTDGATDVFSIDKMGSFTATAPTGSIIATIQTNQNNTGGTVQVVGRTSGAVNVQAVLVADAGGQVTIGAASPHEVVFESNSIEVTRIISDGRFRIKGVASAPSGAAGDIYYDTTTNKHYGHNGTTWNALY